MIHSQLSSIIARLKKLRPEDVIVTDETDLIDDFDLDSIDVTELLYSLEEDLNIVVDFSRLEPSHLRQVGLLRTFISVGSDVPPS